jgi:hypothetical protein
MMRLLSNLRNTIPPATTLISAVFCYYVLSTPSGFDASVPSSAIQAADIPTIATRSVETLLYTSKLSNSDLSVISERPIFSNTRRKPEPIIDAIIVDVEPVIIEPIITHDEPVYVPPEPPKFQIIGMIDRDGEVSALVEFQSVERWKSVGDFIENWKITTITKDAVSLSFSGEEFTMRMQR